MLRHHRYGASPVVKGAFNWALTFKWRSVNRLNRRNREADAVVSPAMAGGLFSIHRRWFIELGTYDHVLLGFVGTSFRHSLLGMISEWTFGEGKI